MVAIFRVRQSGSDTWRTWGRGLREHGAVTMPSAVAIRYCPNAFMSLSSGVVFKLIQNETVFTSQGRPLFGFGRKNQQFVLREMSNEEFEVAISETTYIVRKISLIIGDSL